MKEVLDKMIQHPFRTTMIVAGITSGTVTILRAIRKLCK